MIIKLSSSHKILNNSLFFIFVIIFFNFSELNSTIILNNYCNGDYLIKDSTEIFLKVDKLQNYSDSLFLTDLFMTTNITFGIPLPGRVKIDLVYTFKNLKFNIINSDMEKGIYKIPLSNLLIKDNNLETGKYNLTMFYSNSENLDTIKILKTNFLFYKEKYR